jgi:hypothetical protein
MRCRLPAVNHVCRVGVGRRPHIQLPFSAIWQKGSRGHGIVAICCDAGSELHGLVDMRTFVASALIIAAVLIGQQWVAKASAADAAPGSPTAVLTNAGQR